MLEIIASIASHCAFAAAYARVGLAYLRNNTMVHGISACPS